MVIMLTIIVLFSISLVQAQENLYQYDSLNLQLNVLGQLSLLPTASNAQINEAQARLLLYPSKDYRQEIINWDSTGEVSGKEVNFVWNDGRIENKNFGYNTLIKTENKRLQVRTKIPFPIRDTQGNDEYLKPTATIDSNNVEVIAKASELAEGEDDLFKVAFKLSSWVESNVRYDLNSLTESTSQKASWVLQNKIGVCDEMTSLFVAMMRSLGVPARFVSGISYTTSPLFSNPWQPHGWAEVYFPDLGWVSFDIAFGEYGYVDVTHIKLRDGFDPKEPATKFEWTSNNVQLKPGNLIFPIEVVKKGNLIPDEIQLEDSILAPEIGFNSYNLIKGIVKNKEDYYVASTLQLAAPAELTISGRNRRTLLLGPKEVRETYWIVFVSNLDSSYEYTFPITIYTEENMTVKDTFKIKAGGQIYSNQDIEQLTVQNEEKSYSRKVSFTCEYPKEIMLNEEASFSCTIKNSGNANLRGINFCLGKVCDIIDLPINQEKTSNIKVRAETSGAHKVIVSAENNLVEKRESLEYIVRDKPNITVQADYPKTIMKYGDHFKIDINLKKISFSTPQQVIVKVKGTGFSNQWAVDELTKTEKLTLELDKEGFSSKNEYIITTTWTDEKGGLYSNIEKVTVLGEANNFGESMMMFLNRILGWFS